MGKIGIKCGFCGESLTLEYYKNHKCSAVVFCDNPDCLVQPCSNDDLPSKAMAEAKAFGKIGEAGRSEANQV